MQKTERTRFTFRWEYPTAEVKVIAHKARTCEAVVRAADGTKLRDARGKTVKRQISVPGYTQVIRP